MKIFIGADHNGYLLKKKLFERLKKAGYSVDDEGDERLDPNDDFPVFASRVATSMLSSDDGESRGILICGSGQGMAIAANRYRGIRAIVAWNREQAKLARNDDDANILALPAYIIQEDVQEAMVIVETFLNTKFDGAPRYKRRLKELDEL